MARVLGLDPGFATCGYALVDLTRKDGAPFVDVRSLGTLRTAKADKKRKVLAADDNLRRAQELIRALYPLASNAQAIVAESMSFPRNSAAAAKMAMCWGIVATLAEMNDLPIVQATPKEIKIAVAGVGTATKEDVAAAVCAKCGRQFSEELLAQGLPKGMHEHAYDAVASVLACLNSDVLRAIRRAG